VNFFILGSTYEMQQQMDLLRKIFHKAIQTPLHNIETIWKEYDAYENSLSKLTAKKFISDRAAGYMTARASMKDFKSLMEPIEKITANWYSVPPLWSATEVSLLGHWKRYITWEKSNPLALDDKQKLLNRVLYAYRSALLHLLHFPEVWFDLSTFLHQVGKPEEALSYLKSGIDANPRRFI
jgi:cleavage stimulation factor subunit 3